MRISKRFVIVFVALICVIAIAVGLSFFISHQKERRHQVELMQQVQEYTQSKLEAYAAENEMYADYEMDVAFLGDSLTDGYPLDEFYPQFQVTNRGIGGDTTFALQARLQTSVIDLKPKVIVLLIGGNNLDTMFDNYEDILRTFQQQLPKTKVVLLSLTSMSGDWARKNEIAALKNVKIQLLAQKYGYDFIDLFTPLLDLETGTLRDAYTVDGAHLTRDGYAVVTAAVTPVLEKLLTE